MTDSKPSKSARKREHLALQELGEQLIELNDIELGLVPLEDNLRAAVHAAARMRSHGALRRQKQLIGKLMREADPEPIRAVLATFGADDRHNKQLFATAEHWRDRIVNEGSVAIDELSAKTGRNDDQLRTLQSHLETAPNETMERHLRRQIFRRIHDFLVTQAQDV